MTAKLRLWWQQIQQYRVAIGVVGIVLVVVITLIIAGYWFDWTGFNGHNKVTIAHTISGTNAGTVTKTEEYQPGKTLWDWLQLLIIPLVLAFAALLFNLATTRTEQKFSKQRYEQDQQIALDKQHEDLLQAYLDRISDLLLKESLRTSPSEEVQNVARVRTITVLTQLNARRISYIFTFLREAGLMSIISNSSVVSLKDADLHGVKWSQADLSRTDLSGADLSGADLSGTKLRGTKLSGANLRGANMLGYTVVNTGALGKAYSPPLGVDYGIKEFWTDLSDADLSGADLSGADLRQADLSRAKLSSANLSRAKLYGAKLYGADLSGAKLSGAIVTKEQLKKAKSLEGATMPDGSRHP